MKNDFKAVLWDMDGVLIDSEPQYNDTIRSLMRSFGREYGEYEIAKVTGASFKDFRRIMNLEVSRETVEKGYINALIEGIRNVSEPVPGVLDLMAWLGENWINQAIGSSSPRVVVDFAVQRFGFGKYVTAIVTGSDDVRGKPAPDIFLSCAKLLEVSPEDCLVIEDSINGVKAGKTAGMTVCAFTGTKIHEFDLSEADFSVDSILTIKNFIKSKKNC